MAAVEENKLCRQKKAISQLSWASFSKRGLLHNLSYENEFILHVNRKALRRDYLFAGRNMGDQETAACRVTPKVAYVHPSWASLPKLGETARLVYLNIKIASQTM